MFNDLKQPLYGHEKLKGEVKTNAVFFSLFPFAGISLIRFKGYDLSRD
jgi:hypothetical protein